MASLGGLFGCYLTLCSSLMLSSSTDDSFLTACFTDFWDGSDYIICSLKDGIVSDFPVVA
jgi:hypothetical protein